MLLILSIAQSPKKELLVSNERITYLEQELSRRDSQVTLSQLLAYDAQARLKSQLTLKRVLERKANSGMLSSITEQLQNVLKTVTSLRAERDHLRSDLDAAERSSVNLEMKVAHREDVHRLTTPTSACSRPAFRTQSEGARVRTALRYRPPSGIKPLGSVPAAQKLRIPPSANHSKSRRSPTTR
ncbi:hypothetical protein M427DRAFT_289116 [Gonapodya prolifera JEL478]|uniref:Uncharacterized protein n=1 Tax=Gonapodya prolifera (strain JEL478) TaxID=1344416 RepID=A0A139AIP4_GONPJ|nr:hypothetical protein M427DRAFT_289116 [Gonapodya prolifera JEL478]|eukprot:KXS16682.1 hypothetical protein M427DRAFT_289116 [Gonapodya prolifera JEL478]